MTTSTATKTTKTITDPRTRSLELAAARGETACSHHAHTLGWTLDDESGALVSLALEIDSAHEAGVRYAVGYSAATDDASCECRAAQFGLGCTHRGLSIIVGREVVRHYSPTGRAEAERAYQADLAAQDNARVLGY